MAALTAARYGKDLVRVFRVVRREEVHEVAEYNVRVMVEGDVGASFTQGDNTGVVATDSLKNMVYYVARTSEHVLSPEVFALHVGAFVLERYGHLTRAEVDVEGLRWARIAAGAGGGPHPHAFVRDGGERRVARAELWRAGAGLGLAGTVAGGLVDLLVLKTAGSSFVGFVRDAFTTLAEAEERVFSTAVEVRYRFGEVGLAGTAGLGALEEKFGFAAAAERVRAVTLEVFARDESPSVQATLYRMGEQVLAAHATIVDVSYVLPNKHYIGVDMSYLGIENRDVFVPVDAPSGSIAATVSRVGVTSAE